MERRQNARKRQTAPLPLAAAYLFLLPEPRPSARPLLLPPPAVCWSHHTLTGSAVHGTPLRRPQTPDGTPAFGRRPPFRLAAPRSFGRPRLLRSPPSARNRHALTGSAAHGTPPRRPQTPDGTPAFGRRPPFRLAAPRLFGRPRLLRSPPSARNRHALTGSVAHGTPPKRPQTPDGTPAFGRRLPFPLAGAASFRTAPALAAARRFLLPAPRALSGSRADGRFFMRAQGFARTCRVLPAHVEYY